jgi:tartrate dehydrogenase/decarboxylase/D-malate dehydrogenase
MKHHNISVIPADGIGEEVAPEGVKTLDVAGELTGEYKIKYEYFPYGCNYYLKHGKMMADDGLKILKPFDAIYFGAVGFPTVPDHISLRDRAAARCEDAARE